jgi:hypothetical protein
MPSGRRALTPLLLLLALGCLAAHADDARKAPDDPDPGFLEFLGSVDRLAEVNPDYLSQSDPPGAKPGAKAATPARPPSPPPASPPSPRPQRLMPPSASNASERTNNE